MDRRDFERFDGLTYDDFRRMAGDDSLSEYEKVGFPDSYREDSEEAILADIVSKLPALQAKRKRILDIGPGCSGLPRLLLAVCERQGHEAVLIDSDEMLSRLPTGPHVVKLPGAFPATAPQGPFDAILVYSVLHYVHAEGDVERFLDKAIALLAAGGAMLIGDVPNASKRARFFSSPAGVAFHKRFMGTDEAPPATLTGPAPGGIDDSVVLGLLARARSAGCDAYLVPQPDHLPMANRREDILVVKP